MPRSVRAAEQHRIRSGDTAANTVWVASKASARAIRALAGTNPSPMQSPLVQEHERALAGHLELDGRARLGATALPNVPINVVKVDPGDNQTIYAGTEIGLYRSIDGGASWARYGTGLPLVSVTDLSVALDGRRYGSPPSDGGSGDLSKAGGSPPVPRERRLQFRSAHRRNRPGARGGAAAEHECRRRLQRGRNLAGATNAIDDGDVTALVAKLGGRP